MATRQNRISAACRIGACAGTLAGAPVVGAAAFAPTQTLPVPTPGQLVTPTPGQVPTPHTAQLTFGREFDPPASVLFAVAPESYGLNIPGCPNDVCADFNLPRQQTTLYASPGDLSNTRLFAAVPGGFAPGDAINGISFGRDSTRLPDGSSLGGVLYFSVCRGAQGEPGTAVRQAHDAGVPCEGQELFKTGVGTFGSYPGRTPVEGVPAKTNLLALDGTNLGLGVHPLTAQQDELRDFALGPATPGARWYATMTGPSFAATGDTATIWMYDPTSGPFTRAALVPFATPDDLGLVPGDVITAVAVSARRTGTGEELSRDVRDSVLFALMPGSPTLTSQGIAPATVFQSSLKGGFLVFVDAGMLALNPEDVIDALDIVPIPSPGAVALAGAGCLFAFRRSRA